jgi:hypothetical protein
MVVRLDQSGHDGHARQIDHLRAGRNRHVRPDVGDLVAGDEDDLVRENPAGLGIEKTAGTDRSDRRGRLGGGRRAEQRSGHGQRESCHGWAAAVVVVTRPPAARVHWLNQLIM